MASFKKLCRTFHDATQRALAPVFAAAAVMMGGCQSLPAPPILPPEKAPLIEKAPPPAPPSIEQKPAEQKPKPKRRGYTVTDLLERNIGKLPPANDNLTEEQRLQYYLMQLCFEIRDQDTKTVSNAEIRVSLNEIAQLTLMGKPLVDIADEMRVKFCGLKDLPAGVAALYYPSADTLITSPARSKYDLLMQLTHEMMHAAQDQNRLTWYSASWDIQSRVARNLSTEAAAATAEMLIAYEARLKGDDSYWKYLNFGWGGAAMDRTSLGLLDNTYRAAVKNGAGHEAALMQAGRAAFENVFNNDGWRNFYLNQELTFYVQDIMSGAAGRAANPLFNAGAAFGQTGIDRAGQIGVRGPSFTCGAAVPELDRLLQPNPGMRWAYEAVEVLRLKQRHGDLSIEYAEAYNKALAGQNPYLDLDMQAALAKHQEASWREDGGKTYRYFYQYLDDMLGKAPGAPKAPIWVGPMMADAGHDADGRKDGYRHTPGAGCRARPPAP